MTNTTLVQVRVDEALKDKVTHIYDYYGLDLPTAIRIFMKKTVAVNGLPFDLRDESNKKNIWHYFGSGKDIEMNISAEPDFSADTKLETL
ncbi:MAG: type II toxin-antitoxin system RelB/DinJ family antitoxin [Treponema sp.]|jgi:addiction module antitoxin, relB/dinJ family|uniref:Type II toxin-antitoxin system RelB/DinJ family antitoxin n=1 Tax=Treponema vincentii TaxID=69710 RepID=A0A6P1Y317_9SPIR|nr:MULTISPECIES: type II toxin-antitoxin system RelB/DinJ family antitoxin [Treponema]QHX43302.1 type II toxin-antitoxin system RelB/DinJ family antitoxin [Treponema vincentii]UTC52129.1 type II toxin-antitoxin system RelB/DinJ family antitoxin [Treponema sp. OMZ 803]UTC54524.1 type II toxin-antitoxin system RelB/DinJ family antitoxin [Treponema sp. OMZ 906]